MSMALLLALLLPVLQEDPQVMYREGLFEEVDQGNLEKAAELYGKILKSGAPDALKAKALLRTGFCQEKKGRKKEAEQAWRDVIERYPAAAETVKVARERLSRPETEGANKSEDEQIQALIFNLGSGDDNTRIESRRKLLFLGEAAIPRLRRALSNRDRAICESAAHVLLDMELRDGLYEALRPFWFPKGDMSGETLEILPRLVEEYAPDREKLLKDSAVFKKTLYMSHFAGTFCTLPDPRFSKIVEDWIVETTEDTSGTSEVWVQNRTEAEVLGLMKRFNSHSPPHTGRALELFHHYVALGKPPDRDVKAECLAALAAAPEGTDYFENLKALLPHFKISELVRGPVAAWLAKRPVDDKRKLLENIASLGDVEETTRTLLTECRSFLFEQLAAADVPLETKELILASGFRPDTPEERAKFQAYCLHFWKEQGAKGERKSDALIGVLGQLAYYLPPDSKELPAILDAAFDIGASYPGLWGERPEERRPLVIAAMHRSLKRNEATRDMTLNYLSQHGSPEEKLGIGNLLEELGPTPVGQKAAGVYVQGFRGLDGRGKEAHWKELAKRFESGPPAVKFGMVTALVGENYEPVDWVMKAELSSPIPAHRLAAVQHWGQRQGPEATGHLISALKDGNDYIQVHVIPYLRMSPSLEAVPELIKLLSSPNASVRTMARDTLVEFKKHFEAQAEWQRWYDETKKSLGK